ncbi:MAG: dihydropyrimidinase [Elusimicrobiota bacterium]|nr:dihydropyrimidinase [Elusimicrobiota bacterium]
MDLIIKNGKIVTAEKTVVGDVGIENGKVVAIGKDIKCARPDVEIIDAKNMLVLPGGIDMHVHFNLFFCGTYSENWDTATAAAACGGVTTIIDYAIQQKGKSLKEAVELRQKDAEGKVCIDYSLHGGITDWNEQTKNEMNDLTQNGGIPSFKMFMIYRSQGWMADDGILFSALEQTAKTGALIMLHAENAFILDLLVERYHTEEMIKKYGAYCHTLSRPCFTEYEAVQRAAMWAKVTGGRVYIVHMSASESAEIVAKAKKENVKIWAETCPQYLLLTDDVFKKENGHYYATCPQIKKKHDSVGLLKAIKSSTVEILATDTCTFNTEQKNMWGGDFTKIPYGMPGVETLIPTMFTYLVGKNGMSLNKFVALSSTNPAKLFGLYPQKGAIAKGSDADIVIFDPNKNVTIDYKNLATKCDWSPFQGMKLKGYPVITISNGEVIAEGGKFTGKVGRGKFLKRKPNGKI